jgi:transcriptional regulator of heat shock response
MKDRTRAILEIAVKDFIKTGKPITSEYLYGLYDFGIKPAMIRWELNDLSEKGFFYQYHPSGGRYPTDKAYRFLVDEILAVKEGEMMDTSDMESNFYAHGAKALATMMANDLQSLIVAYDAAANALYGSGLSELLGHLETTAKDEIMDVVNDFELLENRLTKKRAWWEEASAWPKVFIGQSPVTTSEHLSVVAGRFEGDGKTILLLSIGPKRMDYEKSVNMFKGLATSKRKRKERID